MTIKFRRYWEDLAGDIKGSSGIVKDNDELGIGKFGKLPEST